MVRHSAQKQMRVPSHPQAAPYILASLERSARHRYLRSVRLAPGKHIGGPSMIPFHSQIAT